MPSSTREVSLDASAIAPVVTWGTSPEDTLPIDAAVPDPAQVDDPDKAKQMQGALDYMGLSPRQKLTDIRVDRVFIGSCTNARIEDLRAAAAVLSGRKAKVPGLVSAGSTLVKHQAEQEGLDKVFIDGGPHLGRERLLDVPRHQRRHRAAGRALRLDHQPQFPRPAGAGRAHAPDVARDGRGRRRHRPSRRRAADARREGVMERSRCSRSASSTASRSRCGATTSTPIR